MDIAIDIADAVVTELASGVFSQVFVPIRSVLPVYDLADLQTLRVTVVPGAVDIENISRSLSQYDVRIDIGVQKKVSVAMEDDVAGLSQLVAEIIEYCRGRLLASVPNAVWVRVTNDPIYAADHLLNQRTFTSVISITYRVLQ